MKLLVKNFIKADLRQTNLMFWDWIFPIILIMGFTLFARGESYASFILPSILSFLIFQGVIFSVPYRIAQYKENGVIRLVTEEGSVNKFLLAFLFSRVIIVTFQLIVFFPIGVLLLKPEININFGLLLITYVLGLFTIMLLAIFIGLCAKTENTALGLSQMIYMLSTITSGIFYSLEKSPKILIIVSKFSPLRYFNDLMQGALRNNLNDPIVTIVIMGIFMLGLGASLLLLVKKRELKKAIV